MLLFLIAPCIDLCNNRPDHPFHAPQAIHRGNTNNYTIITSPAAPAERRGSAASASGSAAQLALNLWHHVFSALPWWVKTTCCRIGFLRLCAACIDAVYVHRTYPGSVSVCLRVQLCEDMISTTLERRAENEPHSLKWEIEIVTTLYWIWKPAEAAVTVCTAKGEQQQTTAGVGVGVVEEWR